MGYPTAIEWTDATWNPVGGCSIHSPGCKPCYAMALAAHPRLNKHPLYAGTTDTVKGKAVWNGKLTKLPDDHESWTWPLRWRGASHIASPPKLGPGKPSLIFVGDMTDLFHQDRPRADIDRVVAAILHAKHIGQLLTKRPNVMCDYFEDLIVSDRWREFRHPLIGDHLYEAATFPFNRVWLGCSAERQQEADQRRNDMTILAKLGFTTFVSYEPALGPVDWRGWEFLKQLIAGGMSGVDARPAHPGWFRQARDWCAANNVPFFFKQWGEWEPRGEWSARRVGGRFERMTAVMPLGGECSHDVTPQHVGAHRMALVGKAKAGRRLDGKIHNAFPEAA